jgi:hypothetical protein
MVPPAVPNGGCSIVLLRGVGQGRAVLPLVTPLSISDHFLRLGWELRDLQCEPTARQRIGACVLWFRCPLPWKHCRAFQNHTAVDEVPLLFGF